MIVDDKARVIGKVIGINTEILSVELSRDIVNFTINGFDDIHYVAQLNGYVVIPYLNFYIIGEVVSIKEKEVYQAASNLKDQELLKTKSTKVIEVTPFGTLTRNAKKSLVFTFGVSNFPSLYSDVLYIKDEELDSIYTNASSFEQIDDTATKSTHLPIGISSIFKDYEVKADIDKLFGAHSAVLGNTGSGKSCTISSILQSIYRKRNFSAVGSTFLIFDVNGEYEQALGSLNNHDVNCVVRVVNKDKQFRLPHWYFTFEEWELLLNASEKTQKPILHNALGLSGLLDGNNDLSINHIVASCIRTLFANSDSPVAVGARVDSLTRTFGKGTLAGSVLTQFNFSFKYGNFPDNKKEQFDNLIASHILDQFQLPAYEGKPFPLNDLIKYIDLAILYEESHGNKQVRDYCSSMITRAKNIINHPSFNFIGDNPNNFIPEKKFLMDILGVNLNGDAVTKTSQIFILDLNEAEDDAVQIVSAVISRMVLELLKVTNPRNRFPVNIVMEEAHRYISTTKLREYAAGDNIFERIAKEGRKYGIFLLISSQRPSELSRTVLSQCSNFIVHRIQNPEDLSHIRQITPHISDVLLKRLPSIPKQHALIFGACVNIPSLIKILDADPRPKSDDNKISDNWFIPFESNIPIAFG
jgi:uncharacterized protein